MYGLQSESVFVENAIVLTTSSGGRNVNMIIVHNRTRLIKTALLVP